MYDERLNMILKKHDIEIVDERKLNDNLELSVKGILLKHCAGKKCALWGAGRMNITSSHSAILIGKYATYLQNLVCIIDSNPDFQGKSFLGYPIISPDNIKDYDIEIIIISSKNSATSIIESIHMISPESKYIDIYGELRSKGLEVYNNFFDENSIYTKIFDLQQQIKVCEENREREKVLSQLISYYISIRDFFYAFYYIDNYIKIKATDYLRFKSLKTDIIEILYEIIDTNSKKSDDISFFYIDALRNMDVFESKKNPPKILKKYVECGDAYVNAYSTGATTYESMVSAILGKYPLECNVYSKNFLRSFNESQALKYIYKKGYSINWMVSDCYRLIEDDERLEFDIQIYMSKKLWNLVCKVAQTKNKTFNFVYFPYEIHCPMLCGYHKKKPIIRGFSNMGIEHFPQSINEQYKECIDYMDKQFEFYYELLGKNTTKVFFSDHSQVVYDSKNNNKTYNMYYKDKELCTHIPMIVSKESSKSSINDYFISLVDFNEILISVIDGKNLKRLKREIVRYQYYPIHSAKIRMHAINNGFHDYIDGMDIYISDKYIYIITGTGKEEVYIHDNLDNNLIDKNEGQAFIHRVGNIYN